MEDADSRDAGRAIVYLHILIVGLIFLAYPVSARAKKADSGGRAKPRYSISGQLTMTTEFYHTDDTLPRYMPFSPSLYGNLTVRGGGWLIPVSFILSEKERRNRQAFNQAGLSPQWKWLRLHAGYRNIYFSNFTLAGATLLGGGIELNPGKLRFGAVYGRLQREVIEDSAGRHGTYPAFERWGYAAKLGYGNDLHFLDLIFLHARDKAGAGPSYERGMLTPAENYVGGFITRLQLIKNLSFEAEGGLSVYTRNIHDSGSIDDLENLPLATNNSSQALTALRATLAYRAKTWGLSTSYKRIEPEFRSMGAYYFQNDVEQIMLSPRFSLPKKKIVLSASAGAERNNLLQTRASSARRFIGNIRVSWQANQSYGLDLQFSNFGMTEKRLRQVSDSARVAQVQSLLSCTHRLILARDDKSHSFLGNLMYQRLSYREASAINQDSRHFYGTLNYVLGLMQKGISINGSLGYSASTVAGLGLRTFNLNLGAQKAWWDEKLQTGLSSNWQPSFRSGERAGRFLMMNLFASCRLWPRHLLSLDLSYQQTKSESAGLTELARRSEELRGILSYQLQL